LGDEEGWGFALGHGEEFDIGGSVKSRKWLISKRLRAGKFGKSKLIVDSVDMLESISNKTAPWVLYGLLADYSWCGSRWGVR
jgi:hypothetical protein